MIAYSIKADREQLAEAISLFEFMGGNTANALRIAINKTLPQVKTQSSSLIREQVNLTAGYVRDKITERKATKQKIEGRLVAESRGVLLSHFESGAKVSLIGKILTPTNPIKVKVKPGSGQIKILAGDEDTYGQPFYFRLKNGTEDGENVGIGAWLKRSGPQGGRFKAFHGPSVSQVFTTVKDDVTPEADRIYQAQVIDAMRYIMVKQYPPE